MNCKAKTQLSLINLKTDCILLNQKPKLRDFQDQKAKISVSPPMKL